MALRTCFVGGGKMAEAMVRGGIAASANVSVDVVDPNPNRAGVFEALGGAVFGSVPAAFEKSGAHEVVILAVKPQTFEAVAAELRSALAPGQLVLSIMAGIPLAALAEKLGHAHVVRAMPNTPAAIGAGMTVWTADASLGAAHAGVAAELLGAFGTQLRAEREDYLDMATALSGTGPAYYFIAMEAMVDAGVHMGLPRDMARTMVEQTMLGAVQYGQATGLHPAVLRNDITSPGGTTAAAMYTAERGNFRTVIADAVWAAYRKSVAMGGGEAVRHPGSLS